MNQHVGQLIILRHGESVWNAKGVWTGITDVDLTSKGEHEAELMGRELRDIRVDVAYVSQQVRTLQTLDGVFKGMGGNVRPPHHFEGALNERDYGIYTGKNKWDIKAEVGQIKFDQIRRGWDVAIPEGESLRQVYARSVPFYLHTIVPLLASGQNVMMVAHGNSIRSLMKYIESISDSQIGQVDMIFGTIIMYSVDGTGRMLSKTTRSIEAITPFG